MTWKVTYRLQAFSHAIRRTFVQHFTRFQLTVCSHGSSALAEFLLSTNGLQNQKRCSRRQANVRRIGLCRWQPQYMYIILTCVRSQKIGQGHPKLLLCDSSIRPTELPNKKSTISNNHSGQPFWLLYMGLVA